MQAAVWSIKTLYFIYFHPFTTLKHHLEDENAYRTKIYFLGYIQGFENFFFREKEKNATLNTGTLTDQDKIRNARGF